MDLPPPPSDAPTSPGAPVSPGQHAPFGSPFAPAGKPWVGGPPPGFVRPPPSTRSGMAVAALVCGLAGLPLFFIVVPSVLGIVFGFVAASSIRAAGGRLRGAGMARAGWILGIVGVLGFAVLLWAAATGRLDDESEGSAGSLEVGMCIEQLPEGELVLDFDVVECATSHEAEVYAIVFLNESGDIPYPGDVDAERQAGEACIEVFEAYVGESYETSVFELYYTYAQRVGWKATRGNVECLLFEPGRMLTGSMRGANR